MSLSVFYSELINCVSDVMEMGYNNIGSCEISCLSEHEICGCGLRLWKAVTSVYQAVGSVGTALPRQAFTWLRHWLPWSR